MANVVIKANGLSAERVREFLQLVRDFDMKHDAEIPFQIFVEAPELSEAEVMAIYKSLRPPMPYTTKIDLKGNVTEEEHFDS